MAWVGVPGGSMAVAVEACPESWCTLRSPQISVSATYPWTLQVRKDGYATKPAMAQTAAAPCAAAVDTISWKRLTASAATASSTGAATCYVRSAVSQSGSMCASRCQVFCQCRKMLSLSHRPLLWDCRAPCAPGEPVCPLFFLTHLGSIFS